MIKTWIKKAQKFFTEKPEPTPNRRKKGCIMKLNKDELHLICQWFNAVQDLSHKDFLQKQDYKLAEKIYNKLKEGKKNANLCR